MPLAPEDRAALERLLAAHVPEDGAEAAHLATIRAFVARHDDPFDRTIAEGHLTGSAFVIDGRGRLLLTHHRKLGLWLQLGGHAEAERRAHEVALREAREESGLEDVELMKIGPGPDPQLLDVDVHAIPARKAEPAHSHHDLRFLLYAPRPDAIRPDLAESHALEWVTLDEASRRCDAGIRRAIGKIENPRGRLTCFSADRLRSMHRMPRR